MNVFSQRKPPCPQCPYTLGLVQTLVSPCPNCRTHGYKSFEWFRKQIPGNGGNPDNSENK